MFNIFLVFFIPFVFCPLLLSISLYFDKKLRKVRAGSIKENKKAPHICCICGERADLELNNGKWICDNCAQIQGELAEMHN